MKQKLTCQIIAFTSLILCLGGCQTKEKEQPAKAYIPNIFEKGEAFLRGNDTIYNKTDTVYENEDSLCNFITNGIEKSYKEMLLAQQRQKEPRLHLAACKYKFKRDESKPKKILQLTYIIDKRGNIDTTSIHVVRGVDSLIDKFAVQSMIKYQHFKPVVVNNKPVYSLQSLPIIFKPLECFKKFSPPKIVKISSAAGGWCG